MAGACKYFYQKTALESGVTRPGDKHKRDCFWRLKLHNSNRKSKTVFIQ